MSGDVIDTSRNTTPAANQEFVQKSEIEILPSTRFHSQKFDVSIIF